MSPDGSVVTHDEPGVGAASPGTDAPSSMEVWQTTLSLPSAVSVAVSSEGELFVTSYTGQVIHGFLAPLGDLTPNGTITGVGLSAFVEGSTFVDDELWINNYAGSNIVELSFDAQGAASATGTILECSTSHDPALPRLGRSCIHRTCADCSAQSLWNGSHTVGRASRRE